MQDNIVSMNIDPEVVNSIIRNKIEVALLAAMGDDSQKSQVLDAIVMSSMKTKVNSEGKISQYQSENKYEYLDIKVKQVIRGAVKEALDEYVAKKSSTLKKKVKQSIEDNSSLIASNLVKSFAETAGSQWRMKMDINIDTNVDD